MRLSAQISISLLVIIIFVIILAAAAVVMIAKRSSLVKKIGGLRTENKQLRQEFLAEQKANAGKTEFLSRMSHEIRTPVNSIVGLTELAQKVCLEQKNIEKTARYIERINISSQYLAVLLSDILDMTRIESGLIDIATENFELDDVVKRIKAFVEPQAAEKHIRFQVDYDLKHSIYKGDELRINQVLINLLGNAVKFTNANGEILFGVQETDRGDGVSVIRFSVQDTGIGIAKEDQERIFELFEQAAPNVNNRYGGTGLGLTISRKLADLMNGKIYLESVLAKGSVFYFELELPRAEKAVAPVEEESDRTYNFTGKRILLAEDDELNAAVTLELLKNVGFEVDWVTNGQEVVDLYSRAPNYYYAAILMDIQMPVKNGLEAAREIRGLNRASVGEIPILAMSANVFKDGKDAAIEAGMNAFISKPINVSKALKVISSQIENSGY